MPELTPTSNSATNPTEFYKYAYTSLLRRHTVSSCDNVLHCGDEFIRSIESLLNDMQELVYNCTSAEEENLQQELEHPKREITACAQSVKSALDVLRTYKLQLIS